MLNKICVLILSLSLFLIGCGTAPTTSSTSNIRPDLLEDSKELYTILDDNYKNAKLASEADMQKMRIYMNKYSADKIKDFNSTENELQHAILQMMMSNANYGSGTLTSNDAKKKEAMQQYLEGSEKAKKILDIK
jgi:chlorite dismutase